LKESKSKHIAWRLSAEQREAKARRICSRLKFCAVRCFNAFAGELDGRARKSAQSEILVGYNSAVAFG